MSEHIAKDYQDFRALVESISEPKVEAKENEWTRWDLRESLLAKTSLALSL